VIDKAFVSFHVKVSTKESMQDRKCLKQSCFASMISLVTFGRPTWDRQAASLIAERTAVSQDLSMWRTLVA